MTRSTLLIIGLVLLGATATLAQDSTLLPSTNNSEWQAKRKAAKTNTIIGGSAMGLGLLTFTFSAVLTTADVVPVIFGQEPQYENEVNTGTIIGTILFLGGSGFLVAGLIQSSKARKIMQGQVHLQPQVSPLRVGNSYIHQQGVALRWQIRNRHTAK